MQCKILQRAHAHAYSVYAASNRELHCCASVSVAVGCVVDASCELQAATQALILRRGARTLTLSHSPSLGCILLVCAFALLVLS